MWSTCFPKAVVAFLMDRGCSCRTIVQHCATSICKIGHRRYRSLNQKSSKFICKDLVARADLNGKAGKIASWAFPPLFDRIRATQSTNEAKSSRTKAKKLKRPWPALCSQQFNLSLEVWWECPHNYLTWLTLSTKQCIPYRSSNTGLHLVTGFCAAAVHGWDWKGREKEGEGELMQARFHIISYYGFMICAVTLFSPFSVGSIAWVKVK